MKKQHWVFGIAVGAAILITAPANAQSAGHVTQRPATAPVQSPYDAGYDAVSTTPHTFTSVESHWAQPKIVCVAADASSADMHVELNSLKAKDRVQLHVTGECGSNSTPDYSAYISFAGNGRIITKPVQAGDKFDAKISSDGKGNYTIYLKNETQGWDSTTPVKSPTTTDVGAGAELSVIAGGGFAKEDEQPLPKFDSVTVAGTLVNGKPIASFNPTKTILVDANKKPVVDPSAIDPQGSFTLAARG